MLGEYNLRIPSARFDDTGHQLLYVSDNFEPET